MKGVFIYNQLEFRLEVAGEDFCQGDSLTCVLSVKNHSGSSQSLPALRLDLVCANLNKSKQKKEPAFEIISSAECGGAVAIEPQQKQSISWTFELDKNCPISDKAQTMCFLYGSAGDSGTVGQLPATVQPHRHIQQLLTIFDSPFQFVLKGQKSVDGWVKAKMKPPTARRLSLVDELVLAARFDGEALELKYLFKVKAFDTTATSVSVKKAQNEVQQRLEPDRYILTGEHLNHEVLEARIEEALAVVATGI